MKKNNIIIIVLIIIIAILLRSLNIKTSHFFDIKEKNNFKGISKENIFDMEGYLVNVIACEMPASFENETLKAQAVASRTYAYYLLKHNKKLTNDTSTQCAINESKMKEIWKEDYNKYYTKIKTAVMSTTNKILTFNNEPIIAYYFSMSNGYTEDSKYVFGEKEYLTSVESSYEKENRNFKKTVSFTKEKFCNLLNITCNKIIINNVDRTLTHRVNTIVINNKSFTGIEFRKKLNLRSTDFEIDINDLINITTYGYGHGVGMSQYGANYLAKEGYNYEDILKYYYKGVELSSIN